MKKIVVLLATMLIMIFVCTTVWYILFVSPPPTKKTSTNQKKTNVTNTSVNFSQNLPPTTTNFGNQKLIALTFDDGPSSNTQFILDILEHKQAKATFFITGNWIDNHYSIVTQAHQQGHQLANHTMSHQELSNLSTAEIVAEFAHTQKKIAEITGINPQFVRIPYGLYDQTVIDILDQLELTAIGWTIDPEDWKQSNYQDIVNNTLKQSHHGGIILLHDGPPTANRSNTVKALPFIIDSLQEKGYVFVTISELLHQLENTPLKNKPQQIISTN